jgi:hypothetical protein
MWLVPLLIISVLAVAAVSKSPRPVRPPPRQLAPAPVSGHPTLPGPIAVLGEILRAGQYPPPMVVLCAIAEAESIGRRDLVVDIVSAFVAPVVHQHRAQYRQWPVPYERGSCSLQRSCAPAQGAHERGTCAPRHDRGTCLPRQPGDVSSPHAPPQPSHDELLAMLHADPNAFLAMVAARGAPGVNVPIVVAPPSVDSGPASPGNEMQAVPEVVGPPQEEQGGVPGSPISDVTDEAWSQFIGRLEREPPTFSSSRHVGRYRQRRDRLVDLGIDPGVLHGSVSAQRTALDADLVDAYRHAAAGGLTEHLKRPIIVPGHEAPQLITLSGLLGVIQCAGLEGAAGWLERSNDRKRYPYTTQVFLATNGVF